MNKFTFFQLNTTLDSMGSNNINNSIEESSIDKFAQFDNLKKKRKLTSSISHKGGVSNTLTGNKRSRKLDRPIRTVEGNLEETRILMVGKFFYFLVF